MKKEEFVKLVVEASKCKKSIKVYLKYFTNDIVKMMWDTCVDFNVDFLMIPEDKNNSCFVIRNQDSIHILK